MKHTRRRHLQVIAAAAITPALPHVSCAQSWPAKSIRVIIPFTAGSTIDIVARIVFEPLGRQSDTRWLSTTVAAPVARSA
ncbi:MAG: hypothetical protein WBD11_04230, partial [Xanthobacteraceae bacterium]